ncbi:hypothetical protein Tco_0799390 [Tanacetum coccineum]|uniref:Uncharacterized protein n=1 Tax=Tanacetum coccineum TaxID=301880 RepID=A0ABQ4ZTG2_9ASTR
MSKELMQSRELQRNIAAMAKVINDLKNLNVSMPAAKGVTFLMEVQDWDVEKVAKIMKMASELYNHIHKAQVESLKTEKVKDENLHGMDKELRLVLIELPALGAGVDYQALETLEN